MISIALLLLAVTPFASADSEALWSAARRGDVPQIEQLLGGGVDVDATTRYGVSALHFACTRGHVAVCRLLVQAGARVNTEDSFYGATPLGVALRGKHTEIANLLLSHGAVPRDSDLLLAVRTGQNELVKEILERATPRAVRAARELAHRAQATELIELLHSIEIPEATPPIPLDTETLNAYAGRYESDSGVQVELMSKAGKLYLQTGENADPIELEASANDEFNVTNELLSSLRFTAAETQTVGEFVWRRETRSTRYRRVDPAKKETAPIVSQEWIQQSTAHDLLVSSPNWPQFRGIGARGIGDGQNPPSKWNVESEENFAWKTPIPGLGHSCPVVWGERVYLTTAVSSQLNHDLRIGLYGDVDSVADESEHRYQVICIDKSNGELIWLRTAAQAVPQVKRHLKSTHANPTPVTDGQRVVACFGSQGVFCYSSDGDLLWNVSLGDLDSGWFYDPEYQWGFSSSPILWSNLVIIQCDLQRNSFLVAFDVRHGSEVWRVERDEIPSWSSPTVCQGPNGPILLTNGTQFVRGYDAETGSLLWKIGGNSEIAVPTPFAAGNLIYAASGYRNPKPIHAIRLSALGDLTDEVQQAPPGGAGTAGLAWSDGRAGSYLPTPLVYRGLLYVCSNSGIVTCYHAQTGQRLGRRRLRGPGRSFTASPVAADGQLYFTSESGHVYVVAASPELEELEINPLGEYCLSTPAISSGMLFFRGQKHLIAVKNTPDAAP